MKYSSKILLFCLCVVVQAGCSSQADRPAESFAIDSPFKVKIDAEVDTACESARRSLLGQGYLIESSNSDGVKARKAYKSQDDQNTFIEMTIVCLPETSGSTLFATGVLTAYALKKSTSSASVGLSALGSISLPIGQSADSLVKVSEETIDDKEFYRSFFASVDNILGEMRAGKAASPPEAVVVAPEPGPATQPAPAPAAGPEPIQASPLPVPGSVPSPVTAAPQTAPLPTVPTAAAPGPAPIAPVTTLPETAPLQTVPTTVSAPAPAAVDPVAPLTPAAEAAPAESAPVETAPTSPAPVAAPVAPMVTAPATATEPAPVPEQVAPATVPAPVHEQATPENSAEPLRQRQDAPRVTPEQLPAAGPAAVPATKPASAQSTPAIVMEPEPAPMQQAPESATLEQLKPITVQKARWPVISVVPEPRPATVQDAPPPAPEKLPPIDPFR